MITFKRWSFEGKCYLWLTSSQGHNHLVLGLAVSQASPIKPFMFLSVLARTLSDAPSIRCVSRSIHLSSLVLICFYWPIRLTLKNSSIRNRTDKLKRPKGGWKAEKIMGWKGKSGHWPAQNRPWACMRRVHTSSAKYQVIITHHVAPSRRGWVPFGADLSFTMLRHAAYIFS